MLATAAKSIAGRPSNDRARAGSFLVQDKLPTARCAEGTHTYLGPTNTGVLSGRDLNNDGEFNAPAVPFVFGRFAGQFLAGYCSCLRENNGGRRCVRRRQLRPRVALPNPLHFSRSDPRQDKRMWLAYLMVCRVIVSCPDRFARSGLDLFPSRTTNLTSRGNSLTVGMGELIPTPANSLQDRQ